MIKALRKTQKKTLFKKSDKTSRKWNEFFDEFIIRLERRLKDSSQELNFKEEEKVIYTLDKKGFRYAYSELFTLKTREHNKQVDEKNKQLKKEKLKNEMNANFYMKYFK